MEETTQPVVEEEEKSIWELLGIEKPEDDEEEPYAAEEEAMEVETEREDKLAKKLTARVDNLQKKFDQTMLTQAKDRFLSGATDLEKDLFKAVSADVRDMESLAKVAEMVKDKSKAIQTQVDIYEQQAKLDAAAKAHTAWGLGGSPIGGSPAPSDEDKDLQERINKGDSRAALHAMFGDDRLLGGLF